jgi:AcrR family transcriptional regulator
MSTNAAPSDSSTTDSSTVSRILESARKLVFSQGFSGLRMDDLASELGISKKTLYVHFPGKDAIIGAIMEGIGRMVRSRLEAVVNDPKLGTPEKLCSVIDIVGNTMSRLSPSMLRDLKQEAPAIYRKIDEMRGRTIPVVFGRLIQVGIAEGSIRSDVDPEFVCEFWLHAIRGLMDPETLERTQLTPKQTIAKAAALMFNGLFTPKGQKTFQEKVGPFLATLASPSPI